MQSVLWSKLYVINTPPTRRERQKNMFCFMFIIQNMHQYSYSTVKNGYNVEMCLCVFNQRV